MCIVTLFISACFQEILVSAPWRQTDNSAETCSSYVKDRTNKLQNSAFVGVTWVIYFITMHGIQTVQVTTCHLTYIFWRFSLYSLSFCRKTLSSSQNIQRRILGRLVNRELQRVLKEAGIICGVQCTAHVHRNSTGDLSEKKQKYWSVRRYDRLLFKTNKYLAQFALWLYTLWLIISNFVSVH